MKKVFFLLLASFAMFTSCSSKSSLISDLEKACKSGNWVKVQKISDELDKYDDDDFTEEEQLRLFNAMINCSSNTTKELLK